MGLFSSKKKTYVNTTVQRIFEEKQIPDSVKAGILKGIISEENIFDTMMEDVIHSVGIRADTGFGWAKKNDYYWGLPTSSTKSNITARELVLSTIARITGQSITPDYYLYGPMNSIHYGWQTLVSLHNYDPLTNEIRGLTAETGFPCYLTNMVATYRREEFDENVALFDMAPYEQWGPAPASGYTPSKPFNTLQGMGQYAKQSDYEVSDVAVDDYITVSYAFKDAAGVIQTRGRTFSMAAIDLNSDYHQVRFKRSNGNIGFFTYKEGTGTYPDIDGAFTVRYDEFGTFFPWSYLRYDKRNIGANPYSEEKEFVDSQKWLKYLGVDYMMLSDGVNEDPDVDDVAQSLMLFGVNPGAQSQAEIEYLFEYFSLLHANAIAHSQQAQTLLEEFDSYTASPSQMMAITDKFFRMDLLFSGISKQSIPGSIGRVGKFTNTTGTQAFSAQYSGITATGVTPMASHAGGQPYYCYRKQVSENEYEEVKLYNPSMLYHVDRKKGFSAGFGQAELLIPVDRAIVHTMSVRDKEQLLTRALHMVVNTVVVIKTPWYASGIFKWIMIVIAVVITIFSGGSGAGFFASIMAMGAAALTLAVVQVILVSLIMQVVVKLFVKLVGPKLALLAAVVALIAGGYAGFGAQAGSASAMWSETLLSLSSNIANKVTTEYAEMTQGVIEDFTDFKAWSAGQWEGLDRQREELGLDQQMAGLDGFAFISSQPLVVFGETPTELFARTVHSGNIGTLSFDATENYVSTALMLPTLSMSQGDLKNDQPE